MTFLTPTILMISGAFLAAALSAALGANDVANSLGTAVGTGAVSLKQALVIGAIMEFSGAVLFGGTVTKTISSGVVQISATSLRHPAEFMFGMCTVLVGTTVWLTLATLYGLPVSSTHSVVGALIGLGLVSGWGINYNSLRSILMSWLLSPLIGGLISSALYMTIRKFIIETDSPAKATRRLLPFVSASTLFILSMFILSKGQISATVTRDTAIIVSSAIALAAAGLSGAAATAIRSRKTLKKRIQEQEQTEQSETESIFKALQVVTACLLSFSHGSNDVSNAIGPFAAINAVYTGEFQRTGSIITPAWILFLGGVGISTGLTFFGQPVMETVGKKITSLVPTKGFCVELGTALTVLVASELGLPLSTTHTLIGCIVAVGLLSGDKNILNGKVLRNILFSWGVTLPVSAMVTVLCYMIFKRWIPLRI